MHPPHPNERKQRMKIRLRAALTSVAALTVGAALDRRLAVQRRSRREPVEGDVGCCVRGDGRARQGGQEGGDAQRDHPSGRLGQLRQHHQGLLQEVRDQGQLGEPRRHQRRRDHRGDRPKRVSPGHPTCSTWARRSPSRRPRRDCWRRTRCRAGADIPSTAKDANGDWFDDYGGYVAIGYNSKVVKVAPDLVQEPPQPDLQEPGRAQREPDPGRCGLRRRLRGGPGQRRIVQQHRARHRLLQEAVRPRATSCR